MNLKQRVCDFQNLLTAYDSCSRGKKKSHGYQKTLFNTAESLLEIGQNICADRFSWGPYREFIVKDPKKRVVMAAPFMDRVVHHAIHQVIEPVLDGAMSDCVYACRASRGNRMAVQHLIRRLKQMGESRYALKMDVRQYFATISHQLLMELLERYLPDRSLNLLLRSLLGSHKLYAAERKGIPIGNLTSQLFANFYLSQVDRVICEGLGHPYFWLDEKELPPNCLYIRYMDDLLIVANKKSEVCEAAERGLNEISRLHLAVPVFKRMHLGKDPIPFLGFVVDHQSYRPLQKNIRKFSRKQNKLLKQGARQSDIALRRLCFQAWSDLEL